VWTSGLHQRDLGTRGRVERGECGEGKQRPPAPAMPKSHVWLPESLCHSDRHQMSLAKRPQNDQGPEL
jgi:hypothetical protein